MRFYVLPLLVAGPLLQSCQSGEQPAFTDSFHTDSCHFSTTGRNTYFILEPGYQLVLEGKEDGETTRLEITVLNETRKIGVTETRIVEEKETVNGDTVEISRNFFAFCPGSGDIFYFGEEVDIYKKGKIVGHEGAWTAGGKNKPGLAMPGKPLPGSRYYQEIAPGIAMDRAEIVSIKETLRTPAGSFENCLKIKETTPLEPKVKEFKLYAPGVGLIQDEHLLLLKSGFIQ